MAIYAEQAGDLILRATDSQTGWHCDDITLHVVSKDQRQKQVEQDFWADKKFPFTWDFSNVSSNSIVDDEVHWKTYKFDEFDNPVGGNAAATGEHILGMASSFGYDYADEQDPDKKTSITEGNNRAKSIWKYISNGEGENCRIMPEFEGLRIGIGTNSFGRYIHKKDRASLHDANSSNPRFQFIGGDHYLYLPEMPAVKTPGSYKLIMKLGGGTYSYKNDNIDKGNSSHVTVELIGEDGVELSPRQYIGEAETVIGNEENHIEIVSFDISSANAGKALRLALNNASVYWIAFSTEEKTVYQPGSTSYPSSTYSYSKALDLGKSAEVNEGLTTYYASNYDATTNSVTMSSLSENVESGKGLLLKFSGKTTAENEPLSCYMIADPENKDGYVEPSNASTDYLVGTVDETVIPSRFTTVGSDKHTNFVLTNVYWKVYDDGESDDGVTVIDNREISDDWKFVRTAGNVEVGPQKAYLRLPGRLLNLNTSDGSASRAVLNIVFDDDDAETNGIANVKQDNSLNGNDDGWYTLQGVKVKTPTKGGIYIHNGKKIAIK